MTDVTDIKGIGPAKADTLAENGYETVEDIVGADTGELADVDGVGEDRALEFQVEASDLLEEDEEDEEELAGDEFDLTPSEVSEELESESQEEDEPEPEPEPAAEDEDESEDESESSVYSVPIDFENQLYYDVFHAALMRHHEDVYTSDQPASEAMQGLLNALEAGEGVEYQLTEFELNTLHTAVKRQRVDYQGANLIDHMDALKEIEQQIDDVRAEKLF